MDPARSAGGPDRAADAMLLACVLLWSINFTAVAYGLQRFAPLAFTALRFVGAAVVLLAFLRVRDGGLRLTRRELVPAALLAFVGIFLNQVLSTYAIREGGAALLAMLMSLSPVFAAGLAVALGQERPAWTHWAGLGVAASGALLVVGGAASGAGRDPMLGGLLGVLAALTWAAYSVYARPLMARTDAVRLSALVIGAGALMLLPVSALQLMAQDWSAPGPGRWAALAFALVFALLVTNVLWFEGVRRVGAARATMLLYLQPFGGALVALVLLGEPVGPAEWAGGAVILAGVVLSRARLPRSAPSPA
jgi:drug/metabolite transporter (DMT)-like permease